MLSHGQPIPYGSVVSARVLQGAISADHRPQEPGRPVHAKAPPLVLPGRPTPGAPHT